MRSGILLLRAADATAASRAPPRNAACCTDARGRAVSSLRAERQADRHGKELERRAGRLNAHVAGLRESVDRAHTDRGAHTATPRKLRRDMGMRHTTSAVPPASFVLPVAGDLWLVCPYMPSTRTPMGDSGIPMSTLPSTCQPGLVQRVVIASRYDQAFERSLALDP